MSGAGRASVSEPVYECGGERVSLEQLLAVFTDPSHTDGWVSRYSDLHLRVGRPVHYRHDGELVALKGGSLLDEATALKLILPLLAEEDAAELLRDRRQDIDCGFELPGGGANFRVNVFRERRGLAAVVRVLPAKIPSLDELCFPDRRVLEDILALRQGLVIVTGITGSGKSTTIAALLAELARREPCHILSLEDPVEFVLPAERAVVSQRELGSHVRSFAEGLRSALREDPDVIYVGEIRDLESASLALSAAETGHLVFSTLHTRDTRGVVTRLMDMFPPERSKELAVQLSFALSHVIAQRLVRRRVGSGRVIAAEVLRNNHAVAAQLRSGNLGQLYSVLETHQAQGMMTSERCLAELVKAGVIDREEAFAQANEVSVLQRLLS